MASDTSEYYDGSRIFTWLADYTGVSIDQVNFVISQFAALAIASLFRTVLHPSKTNPATRHGFGLIIGLVIGYFCFGKQALHLASLPSLCYIVIRTTSPEIMQRMVLAVSLLYLSIIHLHRQIYDYGSYTLDITGPLMIITQKVTSLAFSIHDGLVRSEKELTKNQKLYAVYKFPSALEYFSYVLHFQAIMAGPALFYKEYIDFIEGNNLIQRTTPSGNLDNNSNSKNVVLEPSPIRAVFKKVLMSMICAVMFVIFLPQYPVRAVKEDNFIKNKTFIQIFWYLYISTLLVRFKYYFAWLFADAICNNSGIGLNGFNDDGTPNWNKFSNINIMKFEFGLNIRESIEAWNMGTNRWLRMIVYERVTKYQTLLTYALSALWHGFYPGYYITFMSGALFTFAARTMRRTIRDYMTGSKEMKLLYDIVTCITTRLVLAYVTFAFVLLDFAPSIRLYVHMYLCLHILALVSLFIVPKVVPKAVPGSSKQLSESAKDSLVNVIKQATPITKSVSHHSD